MDGLLGVAGGCWDDYWSLASGSFPHSLRLAPVRWIPRWTLMNVDEDSFRGSPKTNGQLLRRHILGGVAFLRKFNDMKFIPKDNWGELIHLRFLGWATTRSPRQWLCYRSSRFPNAGPKIHRSRGPGLLFRPNFFCVDANLHIIVSWPAEKRAMKNSVAKWLEQHFPIHGLWSSPINIYIYILYLDQYIYIYYIYILCIYIYYIYYIYTRILYTSIISIYTHKG